MAWQHRRQAASQPSPLNQVQVQFLSMVQELPPLVALEPRVPRWSRLTFYPCASVSIRGPFSSTTSAPENPPTPLESTPPKTPAHPHRRNPCWQLPLARKWKQFEELVARIQGDLAGNAAVVHTRSSASELESSGKLPTPEIILLAVPPCRDSH